MSYQEMPEFLKLQLGENVLPLTGSNAPLGREIAEARMRAKLKELVEEKEALETSAEPEPESEGIRDIWKELHEKRAKYFNSDDPGAGAS